MSDTTQPNDSNALNALDYISRQAAIDVINKYILSFDAIDANFLDGLKTTIKLIKEDVPSAQPERKKGNWVGIDDDPCETFECDRCGFVLDDWIQGALYNFCPNCGADMRGGTDG